jgi:hypothetical protein
VLKPQVESLRALTPIAVLQPDKTLQNSAPNPTAVLQFPERLKIKAFVPTAVLLSPVVLPFSTFTPMPTLQAPVVARRALEPIAVLALPVILLNRA